MKLLKEHKGLIIFIICIILFMLFMSNQVEKNNDRMNAVKTQERN